MSSPDARALRQRACVLAALRQWFDEHGYLEVHTPTLVPSPALEENLYAVGAEGGSLRTSPEFALKRVLAAGLPRIYEIGPCFREDEHGPWHGREFTMIEWYRAGAALPDLMDEVCDLLGACATALGRPVPGPWQRRSVAELLEEHTGLDLFTTTASELSPRDADDWDVAFFRRWIEEVEPHLTLPTIVYDWPASQAALAEVQEGPRGPVAKRFEIFLEGVELANAFLELVDPTELRARFAKSAAIREARGEAPHPIDEALIEAVSRMPSTSGIAVGLDRLVAVLAGWNSIHPGRVDHSP